MLSRCKKNQNFSGSLPQEPPPRLSHEPAAKLTAPPDPHLHFTITSWSFVMKKNIQKLNLCSKTDISKTTWIHPWNVVYLGTCVATIRFLVSLTNFNQCFTSILLKNIRKTFGFLIFSTGYRNETLVKNGLNKWKGWYFACYLCYKYCVINIYVIKFGEDSLYKRGRDMVCLSRPYRFKFFKGCLPKILLGPFLNTWTHILGDI